MSEMIDRVAAALEATANAWGQSTGQQSPEFKLALARAAIEAMREPTDDMKAIEEIHWGYSCHVCGGLTEGWYAMIDEALK